MSNYIFVMLLILFLCCKNKVKLKEIETNRQQISIRIFNVVKKDDAKKLGKLAECFYFNHKAVGRIEINNESDTCLYLPTYFCSVQDDFALFVNYEKIDYLPDSGTELTEKSRSSIWSLAKADSIVEIRPRTKVEIYAPLSFHHAEIRLEKYCVPYCVESFDSKNSRRFYFEYRDSEY